MNLHKNLGRVVALIALISMGFSAPAQAQTSGYYGGSNAYQFGGMPGSFGSSSVGTTNVFNVSAAAGNSTNFLGCGGIGIFNFTKLQFNMSNVIDQLKNNMQTMLAKQLLTTAMSIPQVAAIFDTLNAFGNARFDLFNQSCNLSQIKKDAKDAVIKKCTDSGTDATTCQNNWDSQANAGKWLKDALGDLCKFEDFNKSARTAFCKDDNGNPSNNCGLMAFMPQYRLSLAGSAGGSGGGAACGGSISNYGVKQPVFVLQSSVDAIRTVSHVYTGKAASSIQQARASNVPYSALKLAYDAARQKCNADPTTCGQCAGTTTASAAQPGFVQLATVDLKSLGYADSTTATGTPDAMESRFRKYLNCSDKSDPMMLMKEVNCQLQKIQPGASLGDMTISSADAQNITKGLNIAGDASAAKQLGIDANSAARLLQIATTCTLNTVPIDFSQQLDLAYNQDPDCADAASNGHEMLVAHMAANAMYSFLADAARSGKTEVASDQAQPAGSTTSDTTPASVKKAYSNTTQAAVSYFESQVKYENMKWAGIQDRVKFSQTPGACHSAKPTQVILQDSGDDE